MDIFKLFLKKHLDASLAYNLLSSTIIANPESTEQMKETASVLFSVMPSADSYTAINEGLWNEDVFVDQTTKSSTGVVTKPGDAAS